ncbi:hypothetical protein A8U91_02774 [Halomonas elongata]|uniref:Uncharacterized protein n=1 Tax=Halomonas elongata TaxID=2746 RepID=A0A1B8NUQ3_HALEL|nr:hypothetical protein A8U91_02774 [Halomonas elongata]
MKLGDVLSSLGAAGCADQLEAQRGENGVVGAALAVLGSGAVEEFGVVALLDPGAAQFGQPAAQVDAGLGVGVGAGGVVDQQRRVVFVGPGGAGRREADLAEGDADVGPRALDMDLARTRQGLDGGLVDAGGFVEEVGGLAHGRAPLAWMICQGGPLGDRGHRAGWSGGVSLDPYAGPSQCRGYLQMPRAMARARRNQPKTRSLR